MSDCQIDDLLKLDNYLSTLSNKFKSTERPQPKSNEKSLSSSLKKYKYYLSIFRSKGEPKDTLNSSRVDKYFYSREEVIGMITSFEQEVRYDYFYQILNSEQYSNKIRAYSDLRYKLDRKIDSIVGFITKQFRTLKNDL